MHVDEYRCDRCGRLIHNNDHRYADTRMIVSQFGGGETPSNWDLCSSCASALQDWIDSGVTK